MKKITLLMFVFLLSAISSTLLWAEKLEKGMIQNCRIAQDIEIMGFEKIPFDKNIEPVFLSSAYSQNNFMHVNNLVLNSGIVKETAMQNTGSKILNKEDLECLCDFLYATLTTLGETVDKEALRAQVFFYCH